jgi:hypothetical protein
MMRIKTGRARGYMDNIGGSSCALEEYKKGKKPERESKTLS